MSDLSVPTVGDRFCFLVHCCLGGALWPTRVQGFYCLLIPSHTRATTNINYHGGQLLKSPGDLNRSLHNFATHWSFVMDLENDNFWC